MRKIDEFETTSNRSLFNKIYKIRNAKRCSHCKWHPTNWRNSENSSWDKFSYYENGKLIGWIEQLQHYPSWKLTSKCEKQWDKKKVFKTIRRPCYMNKDVIFVQFIW